MEECNSCLTKIKKRSKNKHEQSKKHKYFSNLIINKYILEKNHEVDKFGDIIQSNYDKHKKEFDKFTVCVMWKKKDMLINKISIPSAITLEKPHLFSSSKFELPIVLRVPANDSLDQFHKECILHEVDEINMIFVSDLEHVSFNQYMIQPKSMLCRRLIKIIVEESYGNSDYNWLQIVFRNKNNYLLTGMENLIYL